MKSLMTCLLICLLPVGWTSFSSAQDFGIDLNAMDRNVRVQDDLFDFVNGSWLKNTEIPDDKSNFGSFIVLADRSQERVKDLIEEASKQKHEKGSDAQKVGDFYKSFMNTERIDQLGISPIKPYLAKIRAMQSKKELVDLMAKLQYDGIGSPIGFFIKQDDKDSSQYAAHLIQSGTTLPDRDYYLSDDQRFKAARNALRNYVEKLMTLAGHEDGEAKADIVLNIESKLAAAQWKRTELRDPVKRYNKFKVEQWQKSVPQIDWASFFKNSGVEIDEIIVMTPSFFEKFGKQFEQIALDEWITYFEFHILDSAAPFLSTEFADAHFELHSKQLAGIKKQKDRWKRAVDAASGGGAGDFGVLGEVVGRLYVEKFFKAKSKAAMEELVDNLLKSFETSIDELTWMTAETKKKAQEKLAKITPKIGYPNEWRDYSKLEIEADDLVGNMIRSNRVEFTRMVDKLGKPVDRNEWGMTPQTVNAYYNPGKNEIVFPAAILQPPFFNVSADSAINYGGIGAVIGHEISHAFDDSGSKYDGDGNLNNWWTDEDRAAFKELTKRLIDQYGSYKPLPENSVNGRLTLGENIADLSGLAISFKAYQLSNRGKTPKEIAGWTGEQRFFLGWSQVWRRKYRDAELVRRLLTDPHSPSRYRANGPVTNIDAFYEAFNVKKGDKMFKAKKDRIRIW